jgi:hypothetical protein
MSRAGTARGIATAVPFARSCGQLSEYVDQVAALASAHNEPFRSAVHSESGVELTQVRACERAPGRLVCAPHDHAQHPTPNAAAHPFPCASARACLCVAQLEDSPIFALLQKIEPSLAEMLETLLLCVGCVRVRARACACVRDDDDPRQRARHRRGRRGRRRSRRRGEASPRAPARREALHTMARPKQPACRVSRAVCVSQAGHTPAHEHWRIVVRALGVAQLVLQLVGLIYADEAVPLWALDFPSGQNLLHTGKVRACARVRACACVRARACVRV